MSPPNKNTHTEPVELSGVSEMPGWIVLGLVSRGDVTTSLQVPVLAFSADAAMSLAAARHAGFQPVGVMGENELLDQIKIISNHRKLINWKI